MAASMLSLENEAYCNIPIPARKAVPGNGVDQGGEEIDAISRSLQGALRVNARLAGSILAMRPSPS